MPLIDVESEATPWCTLRAFNSMEQAMKVVTSLMLAAAVAVSAPVAAQQANPHAGHAAHAAPAAKGGKVLYTGEVKRVNADASRVTLAHGPLSEFDMPAMTMAFTVKDAKQIAGLKEGDKVRFTAESTGDAYVITRIESAK